MELLSLSRQKCYSDFALEFFGFQGYIDSADFGIAYLFDAADPNYSVAFRSDAAAVVHQVSFCYFAVSYTHLTLPTICSV